MQQHNNGLEMKTHAKLAGCLPGLDITMKQKLWTLAPIAKIRKQPKCPPVQVNKTTMGHS